MFRNLLRSAATSRLLPRPAPRPLQVWSRVKEALSSAEEARLARDSALARAADLERQAELANTRLATVRQVGERGGWWLFQAVGRQTKSANRRGR